MALLYVSLFTAVCWILCRGILHFTQDPKEPHMIPHTIPFLGHLGGLLRHGSRYFGMMRSVSVYEDSRIFGHLTHNSTQYSTSFYTLRLPWSKLYIISSPKIVAAVDRHSSTLSLAPYALEFVKRVTLPSKQGLDILEKSFRAGKGAQSFHTDTIRAMSIALAPGTALEQTTSDMLSSALRFLESMDVSSTPQEVDLFSWTKSLLTQASTCALYGPANNPFQDPAVEAALW